MRLVRTRLERTFHRIVGVGTGSSPGLTRFAVGSATAALGIALVSLPQACTKRLPHGGEDPVYPLRGLHAAVPCEGCHGEGTPKALPTLCIDCHEDDRPDPDHNPGQNCAPCHTEFGWDQVVTTLTRDTSVPGETGAPTAETGTISTGADHPPFLPDQLCWDCHEAERLDLTHYYDEIEARRWDCGPCHTLGDWAAVPYEHPVRTPHGTFSDGFENVKEEWVVACIDCHTTPEVYTTYDCQSCHTSIYVPPGHYGLTEASAENNLVCTDACHPTGE